MHGWKLEEIPSRAEELTFLLHTSLLFIFEKYYFKPYFVGLSRRVVLDKEISIIMVPLSAGLMH